MTMTSDGPTSPTPDEAAARLRTLADTTLRGALWQDSTTREDVLAVLTERAALRAELAQARDELSRSRAKLGKTFAELAAVRPVLDAAEEYVEIGGRWSHNELVRAVTAYRAAVGGSAEADEPEQKQPPRYLASVCDTCGHTYNHHASTGVCEHVGRDGDGRGVLCPCARFVDLVAAVPASVASGDTEPHEPVTNRFGHPVYVGDDWAVEQWSDGEIKVPVSDHRDPPGGQTYYFESDLAQAIGAAAALAEAGAPAQPDLGPLLRAAEYLAGTSNGSWDEGNGARMVRDAYRTYRAALAGAADTEEPTDG
jgi:hypothetical protein